jgi:hypothetical protein
MQTVIYLIGKPGVGKYTIARSLIRYDFVVCDNQLINNPIFELLNYDGLTPIPEFAWDAITKIREVVLDFVAIEKNNNYVFTNVLLNDDADKALYEQVKQTAIKRGSLFVPVKLAISKEEHLKRVTQPTRRQRWKSVDPNEVEDRKSLLEFEDPNLLILDVSNLSADAVAQSIMLHIELCRK